MIYITGDTHGDFVRVDVVLSHPPRPTYRTHTSALEQDKIKNLAI